MINNKNNKLSLSNGNGFTEFRITENLDQSGEEYLSIDRDTDITLHKQFIMERVRYVFHTMGLFLLNNNKEISKEHIETRASDIIESINNCAKTDSTANDYSFSKNSRFAKFSAILNIKTGKQFDHEDYFIFSLLVFHEALKLDVGNALIAVSDAEQAYGCVGYFFDKRLIAQHIGRMKNRRQTVGSLIASEITTDYFLEFNKDRLRPYSAHNFAEEYKAKINKRCKNKISDWKNKKSGTLEKYISKELKRRQ